MRSDFLTHIQKTIDSIRQDGFYKTERVIESPQSASVQLNNGKTVLNFCANNYLGLANDARLIQAAQQGLEQYGFGLASVRFICGTQTLHKELEKALSDFLETEDTILYSSCFDANGGLFETLLGEEDAIISDALNHASIIDGIRLCKAQRLRYQNNNMADLEAQLKQAEKARFKLIATDGVFSMDGILANLPAICDLADRYNALVMVDDSHAVGFIGKQGRGTAEYYGVEKRIDIYTGTLGKALGGASGGYISGRKEIIELLRQRSRPYLFSNTLAPAIAAASLAVLKLLASEEGMQLRQRVHKNSEQFRQAMQAQGFTLAGNGHPIIPIMLGDAQLANRMAEALLDEGIYVTGFSYPVVPKGQARIRTQMSAAHTPEHVTQMVEACTRIGRILKII